MSPADWWTLTAAVAGFAAGFAAAVTTVLYTDRRHPR